MSELQTEDMGTVDNAEAIDTGTVESGAELATASGEGHEQKPESFNQEAANKAINKKHFQFKEAERQQKAAEDRANELEAKLQSLEVGSEPVIPPMVDGFDEDYEAKQKARDEAIVRKAQFDSQQKFQQEQQSRTQQEVQQAEQKRVNELLTGFNNRATQLGVDQDELGRVCGVVSNYGINQDLESFILEDNEGPLITKYLAANPLELEALNSMNPMQAAIKVNSEIRQRASSMKPQVSNAPEPPETINGGGVVESPNPWVSGGSFS